MVGRWLCIAMSATAAKRVGRTVLKRNIRSAERLLSRVSRTVLEASM